MAIRIEITQNSGRLDRFLTQLRPEIPRSRWESWIRLGHVLVNGAPATKNGQALKTGDLLETELPDLALPAAHLAPEQIDLPTLYEDEYLWIINKPAGMVVHPGPGHPSGTVLNALLSKIGPLPKTDAPQTAPGDAGEGNGDADEEIGEATRAWPGLVHRLDRFTSGCLAMAKDEDTKTRLQAQFKARTVEKTYLALARQSRRLPELGSLLVNAPLARHRIDRTKMVINSKGKEAQTKVKVLARANGLALVSCDILTGRTHQIRVHLSSLGAPLLGDPLYGGATAWKGLDGGQLECPHPALHSWKLALSHPNGERIKATAEIPKALECLLAALGMDLADG